MLKCIYGFHNNSTILLYDNLKTRGLNFHTNEDCKHHLNDVTVDKGKIIIMVNDIGQ
jgi:hypothetical protein